ncbi:MAG: hypothetical protein PHY99_03145 [Bacteroidales bacterium]|nr:hypothetical protein [Bacteroidales bacterium]
MRQFTRLLFFFVIIGYQSQAQTDTSAFKPQGKVIVHVINRSLFESEGTENKIGMYINRAHIGYSYQFAPKWSATAIMDVGRPTVFGNLNVTDADGQVLPNSFSYKEGSYYTMGLKFSYLEYNPTSQLKLQAGGILQNHYATQEKFWGYRYVMEMFQDRSLGMSSSDLGIIAYYSPLQWLSVDAAITNGEGFRFNQDKYGDVKYAAGISVKPVKGWITRLYCDYSPSTNPAKGATQQLFSVFTGYRWPEVFRIGAEYNYHQNHNNLKGNDLYGFSGYATYEMSDRFEIFGRYDHLQSNTLSGATDAWNLSGDGKTIVAGVHFIPVTNISLSLTYQGWKPDKIASDNKDAVVLSFEFKM